MNQKEFIEFLLRVEREFPVNDLKHRGIRCWPMIRSALMSQLLYVKAGTTPNKPEPHRPPKQANASGKENKEVALAAPQAEDLETSAKRPAFLSYSFVSGKLQEIDGQGFSKFTDSLNALLNGKFSVCELAEQRDYDRKQYQRAPIYIDEAVRRHREQSLNGSPTSTWPGRQDATEKLDHLTAYLSSSRFRIAFGGELFMRQLEVLHGYRAVFLDVLKRLRPKLVFINCYYHTKAYALTLACKDANITTVEIQHGQQGDYHPMYTTWTKIPPEGYEILPEYFWMWGKKSIQRIEAWATKTDRHKAILGGNPWLTFRRDLQAKASPAHSEFFAQLDNHQGKVVLVTLQPVALDQCIPPFLMSAMEQSKDIYWCIRLHPRMVADAKRVIERLGPDLAERYEWVRSTEAPLYDLLRHVDVHLTSWSSVTYEALAFGVHSILLHQNGLDVMEHYIQQGIFGHATSAPALLDMIENREFKKEGDEPYIVCERSATMAAIETLLARAADVGCPKNGAGLGPNEASTPS